MMWILLEVNADAAVNMIASAIPIIVVLAVIGGVCSAMMGLMNHGGGSPTPSGDIEELEEDPEKILKLRFARGEITSEEYSERMARL